MCMCVFIASESRLLRIYTKGSICLYRMLNIFACSYHSGCWCCSCGKRHDITYVEARAKKLNHSRDKADFLHFRDTTSISFPLLTISRSFSHCFQAGSTRLITRYKAKQKKTDIPDTVGCIYAYYDFVRCKTHVVVYSSIFFSPVQLENG